MHRRSRSLLPVLGITLALVTGCTDAGGSSSSAAGPRVPGSAVSKQEAGVLAELLHRDFQRGGADFTETAPFTDGALITLTGTVDFTRPAGHATAVTTYVSGQPSETREVFFTDKEIWFGGVPGLPEALTKAGVSPAGFIKRPLSVTRQDGTPNLTDLLAQLVLNLSARKADDPRSFENVNYTWRGQRSINGKLASEYTLSSGATVSVEASDKLLVQYVTPLPDQDFKVTITLPAHGGRTVDLPADDQTVDASAHQDIATAVGV
jgi:hypothetical protein